MRRGLLVPAAVAAVLLAAGCGGSGGGGVATPSAGPAPAAATTIALFLPESKTTRYEAFDRPLFQAKIAQLCPDCKVLYANADQDPAKIGRAHV